MVELVINAEYGHEMDLGNIEHCFSEGTRSRVITYNPGFQNVPMHLLDRFSQEIKEDRTRDARRLGSEYMVDLFMDHLAQTHNVDVMPVDDKPGTQTLGELYKCEMATNGRTIHVFGYDTSEHLFSIDRLFYVSKDGVDQVVYCSHTSVKNRDKTTVNGQKKAIGELIHVMLDLPPESYTLTEMLVATQDKFTKETLPSTGHPGNRRQIKKNSPVGKFLKKNHTNQYLVIGGTASDVSRVGSNLVQLVHTN